MITITISEWFIYERVLIRCFPEKINAKSPFSVLVIVIERIQQKNDKKKPHLHHYLLHVKSQICIGIAKIEKLKT